MYRRNYISITVIHPRLEAACRNLPKLSEWGEIRRYLILNSDPNEYPPIGTSLGHFREHGNGRAMFRLQYHQHSYLSDLTGKPRMRKKVPFSSASGLTSFIYILRGPQGPRNEYLNYHTYHISIIKRCIRMPIVCF